MDPFTASTLVGGAGLLGTIWQTGQNRDMMNDQMAFQEQMRGNAHQTEVQDLRAAGLNPILSAGGSGAAMASGSAGQAPSNPGDAISTGVSTGLAVQKQNQDLQAQKSVIANTEADTLNKIATNPVITNQAINSGLDAATKKRNLQLLNDTYQAQVQKAKLDANPSTYNIYQGLKRATQGTAKDIIHGTGALWDGVAHPDLQKGMP